MPSSKTHSIPFDGIGNVPVVPVQRLQPSNGLITTFDCRIHDGLLFPFFAMVEVVIEHLANREVLHTRFDKANIRVRVLACVLDRHECFRSPFSSLLVTTFLGRRWIKQTFSD